MVLSPIRQYMEMGGVMSPDVDLTLEFSLSLQAAQRKRRGYLIQIIHNLVSGWS